MTDENADADADPDREDASTGGGASDAGDADDASSAGDGSDASDGSSAGMHEAVATFLSGADDVYDEYDRGYVDADAALAVLSGRIDDFRDADADGERREGRARTGARGGEPRSRRERPARRRRVWGRRPHAAPARPDPQSVSPRTRFGEV
ncbi:hypothetical protein BRC97_01670 [Halobacteriales archaeon QS_6_71_20]|nr:MAG: hypothetical protein BRC97_01670 [Halobacteriales archaeon QS_6_71_20]